jgi:hypothetical protein
MTTQTATRTTIVFASVKDLEARYREAAECALAAWKTQSVTTAEEGYSIDQANAALAQAIAADAEVSRAWTEWQESFPRLLPRWEDDDDEIDYSDLRYGTY